jgi:hypothetical protein
VHRQRPLCCMSDQIPVCDSRLATSCQLANLLCKHNDHVSCSCLVHGKCSQLDADAMHEMQLHSSKAKATLYQELCHVMCTC